MRLIRLGEIGDGPTCEGQNIQFLSMRVAAPFAGPFGCLGFWVSRLLRESPRVDAAQSRCHMRSRRSKADLRAGVKRLRPAGTSQAQVRRLALNSDIRARVCAPCA